MNLLILVGCSASGKDTVMNRLVKEFDVKPVISYTTRPIRDCEQEGREYHFITEKEFERMKDNDEFIETEAKATTVLKDGDNVEFLYFMGGGSYGING